MEIIRKTYQQKVLWLVLIIITGFITLSPLLKSGFIIIDDPQYVYENQAIRDLSPKGIANIFTSFTYGHYQPLSVLSYAVDYLFWGDNPMGYHLTNLLLHLGNVLLVFFLARKLFKNENIALFSALLFCIHPMHVESVAWVSERKDVLYGLFYLAACLSYLNFLDKDSKNKTYPYLSLVFFAFSLLAKSMAMTLPLVLLAMDYFVNKKVTLANVLQKIPMLALSVVFGVIAIRSQQAEGFISSLEGNFNLIDRFFLLTYSVAFYLVRFIWPFQSGFYYPYPVKVDGLLPYAYYMSAILLVVLSLLVLFNRRHRHVLLFGALFFLISISVVLRIVPLAGFLWEHNVYIPYVGLYGALTYLLFDLMEKRKIAKLAIWVLLPVLVLSFAVKSHLRAKQWESSFSIAQADMKRLKDSTSPYIMRGRAWLAAGNNEQAIADANKALEINPDSRLGLLLRASIRQRMQDFTGIVEDYNRALQLQPNDPLTLNNRGLAFIETGEFEKAEEDFNQAIRLLSTYAHAYHNRAGAKLFMGQLQAACQDYQSALKMGYAPSENMLKRFCNLADDSQKADVLISLGRELASKNHPTRALSLFETALAHDAAKPQLYFWMGNTYQQMKRYADAEEAYSQSIARDNGFALAYAKRAALRGAFLGKAKEALTDLNKALELEPDLEEALFNRAVAHAQNKNFQASLQDLEKIIQLNPSQHRAYMLKGITYLQMGKMREACADWSKALSLGNNDASAYLNNYCKP